MECMRKVGGESKNGTSRMSVIIHAGALAMLPDYELTRHDENWHHDLSKKFVEEYEKIFRLFETYCFCNHTIGGAVNYENLVFCQNLVNYNQNVFRRSLNDLFSSLLETASKLNEDTQDQRRSKTFMETLGHIELIWYNVGITIEDIRTGNLQNNDLKRVVVKATNEYMEEFAKHHLDLLEEEFAKQEHKFRNIHNSEPDRTKRIRVYWIGKREESAKSKLESRFFFR